jgi:hypothetical protein
VIDITDLDKAALLAALYNNARLDDQDLAHAAGSMPLTAAQAAAYLASSATGRFDHLRGRVLKVDLPGSALDPTEYDLYNGEGKAARVIENLRQTGSIEEII